MNWVLPSLFTIFSFDEPSKHVELESGKKFRPTEVLTKLFPLPKKDFQHKTNTQKIKSRFSIFPFQILHVITLLLLLVFSVHTQELSSSQNNFHFMFFFLLISWFRCCCFSSEMRNCKAIIKATILCGEKKNCVILGGIFIMDSSLSNEKEKVLICSFLTCLMFIQAKNLFEKEDWKNFYVKCAWICLAILSLSHHFPENCFHKLNFSHYKQTRYAVGKISTYHLQNEKGKKIDTFSSSST